MVVLDILENTLNKHYDGELNKITINIYDTRINIGVGYGVIFAPDSIPIIWEWLKENGQAEEAWNNYKEKVEKEIDTLRKTIYKKQHNLDTVFHKLHNQ
jgi:hypothetical protein